MQRMQNYIYARFFLYLNFMFVLNQILGAAMLCVRDYVTYMAFRSILHAMCVCIHIDLSICLLIAI